MPMIERRGWRASALPGRIGSSGERRASSRSEITPHLAFLVRCRQGPTARSSAVRRPSLAGLSVYQTEACRQPQAGSRSLGCQEPRAGGVGKSGHRQVRIDRQWSRVEAGSPKRRSGRGLEGRTLIASSSTSTRQPSMQTTCVMSAL
jgi:hypothetical protein